MLPHLKRLNVLLAELRRRQVFRAAALYAVVAWGVIEVSSTVLPVLLLPEWIVRAVVVILVLGFPVTLVLAWAFDLTPEGVRRTGEVEGALPPVRQFLQSFRFRATLVLLVLAITGGAGWVGWQVWLKPGALRGPVAGTERGVELPAKGLDPTHVAVLYFDDFSSNGELGYFANGLTEALIHELSQADPLRVVSRNGVKPYRDLAIPLDSLARVLGVGSVVEGSVEGAGDRIAVTVQLIEGTTGLHLLSERIEGEGADALALRDTIVAKAVRLVGQRLGRELESRRARKGTDRTTAWELFQRGDRLREDADTLRWARGDTAAAGRALIRADSLFGEAAAADPDWIDPLVARGWTARTRAALFSASASFRDVSLLHEGARWAERALQVAPADPKALELRGALEVDLMRQADPGDAPALARSAEADLRAAVEADPARALAWVALADLLRTQGLFQEAAVAAQHALEADPFLINAEKEILFTLSQVWLDLGDLERAMRWTDEGRRRYPAEPSFAATKLVILAGWAGVLDAVDTARAVLGELEEQFGNPTWSFGRLQLAAVLAQHGMVEEAAQLVQGVHQSSTESPWLLYYEANVRLRMGEREEALSLLEAFLRQQPQRRSYIARDWWWRPLREEPRFQAMVADGTGSEG